MTARMRIPSSDFILGFPAYHFFRLVRQTAPWRRRTPFRAAGKMCSRLNQSPTVSERPPRAAARDDVGGTLDKLCDGRRKD